MSPGTKALRSVRGKEMRYIGPPVIWNPTGPSLGSTNGAGACGRAEGVAEDGTAGVEVPEVAGAIPVLVPTGRFGVRTFEVVVAFTVVVPEEVVAPEEVVGGFGAFGSVPQYPS